MKTATTNVVPLPSLENHLIDCEERYQAVIYKLDVLDRRMTGIEQLLLEIKQAVKR
jgi:hypothetical protein